MQTVRATRRWKWKGVRGSKPWKIYLSCRHFIMLLGELQIQQNIKTGYLQAGNMRVCDFCTHYTICGHQPHDSSVLWQRLRGAPVYQNDLFYPCSFIVKSKWLLSNFIDAPVSDFPRSNLLGVLWAFRCPLPFAQPCFLVSMSSNELHPSVRTGSQPARGKSWAPVGQLLCFLDRSHISCFPSSMMQLC